jgi:hypothetical protein
MRRIHGFCFVVAVLLALGVALGALAVGTAQAKTIIVLPRPGQVGVSGSYLYGSLLRGGSVGDMFGSGPGMAVRVRYRMRYERGFGLSFEGHRMDARPGDQVDFFDGTPLAPGDPYAHQRLNLFLYGADFYQLFGTRTKMTKMLSVGGGLAHPIVALNDGENEYPFSDGAYLSAGAGIERFFWQSVAFDLGARYQAVFLDGKVNHDLQASIGLIFYASL